MRRPIPPPASRSSNARDAGNCSYRVEHMTTMKQRAAARRNIKKAIAANRRHGGKKSHRSGRSTAGAPQKSEALGSTYLNAKMAVQGLSPVTGSVLANTGNSPAQLRVDFGS